MSARPTVAAVVAVLTLLTLPIVAATSSAAAASELGAEQVTLGRATAPALAGTRPFRRDRAATGRLKVTITTPTGVAASVRLKGPSSVVVRKPEAGRRLAKTLRVSPGRYKVIVDPVVTEGVLYQPLRVVRAVTVHGDRRAGLALRLVKADAARLGVTAVAATSADLAWRGPAGATYALRRATGPTAPRTRAAGARVAVQGRAAHDQVLAASTTYSYALFVRRKDGVWAPPVATTLTTSPAAGEGGGDGASVTLPGAVVVPPTATPDVTVTSGKVRWRVPTGDPVPALGGGVVLPKADNLPFGFVGRVATIAPDGHTLTLVPGALVDVFSYLDVAVDLDTLPSQQLHVAPRQRRAAVGSDRHDGCGVDAAAVLPGIALDFEPGGHLLLGIHNSFGIPDGLTYDVRFAPTFTYHSGVHVTAGVSCTFDLRAFFATIPNPLGLPLAVKAGSEITLSTEGAADLAGYTLAATVGGYVKGTLSAGDTHVDDSGQVFEVSPVEQETGDAALSSITLSYGSRVTFGFGGGTPALGAIGGISGHLEPVSLTLRDANAGSSTSCRNVDLASSGGLGLNVSAWAGPLSASASVDFMSVRASWPGFPADVPTACGTTTLPTIATTALSPATIGVPYSARLRSADDRPGTWTLTSGVLPDGLELSRDGLLSGTPAAPKVSVDLEFRLTDNRGRAATRTLTLTVDGFAPTGFTSAAVVPTLPADAKTTGQSSPLTYLSCAKALTHYCVASGNYVRTDGTYEPYLVVDEGADSHVLTLPRDSGTIASVAGLSCPEPGWCALWGAAPDGTSHVLVLDDDALTDLGEVVATGFADDGGYSNISSLSCAAAGDCAAVGTYLRPGRLPSSAVVVDLHGLTLTAAPAPLPAAAAPGAAASGGGVTCRASGWCLALGEATSTGAPFKLALVRDNGRWSAEAAPVPEQGFGVDATGDLVCPADGECSALGRTFDQGRMQAIALRLHAHSWSLTTLPQTPVPAQGNDPTDVQPQEMSCPTVTDCVAVSIQGDRNSSSPYYSVLASTISRFHNGTWTTTVAPDLPGSDSREPQGRLTNVVCSSRGSCVIVGTSYYGSYGSGVRRAVGFLLDGAQAPQQLAAPDVANHSYAVTVDCASVASCVVAGWYDIGYSASPGLLYRLDLHE